MPNPNVNADIRDFYFYFKYLWAPADFENLQKWLRASIEGTAEGAYGAAILSGLNPTAGGGLNVDIDSGLAVNYKGRLLVLAAPGSGTFASPVGNPAWSLLVLRPSETNTNLIPEPQNPSNNVPLHLQFGASLVVINGTPSVTPSYPATQAGDVIVAGVKLTAGQVTILQSDIDRTPINTRLKTPKAVTVKTANYTVVETDQHLDFDCTSGNLVATMPDPSDVPGQDFTIVKTDSSVNTLTVNGTSMSGQSSILLEDQWQTITLRSIGTAYRVI